MSVNRIVKTTYSLDGGSPFFQDQYVETSLHPSLAISATLPTTALAATFRLPPGPAGTPTPPPPGFLLTRRTAVPRLGMPGLKEPLAPLQQAAAPPRPPARALPRRRSSFMLKKTQG